jgi:hypothetical protein
MSYDPYAGWTSVSYSDQKCTGGYGLPSLMVRHDPMDYGTRSPRIEALYNNPAGYSTPTYNTFLTPLDSHYNKAAEALGVKDIPLEHLHRHIPATGNQLLPPMQSPIIDVSSLERQSVRRTPISRSTPNSNVSNLSERRGVLRNLSEYRGKMRNLND